MPNRDQFIKEFMAKWPAPYVPRNKFAEFSGGLRQPGTLANADCLGRGPAGRIKIGKSTAYPVREAAGWLFDQIQTS
ncbi:MAG: hypothetical protein KKC99_01140 [Proteobacteria bacterium]|nr:hypothetical protein [Pseudomonadota bacterium]